MKPFIEINGRRIGEGCPAYIVAEMSANHNQDFDQAVEIIKAAKEAGADAIKLQTATPDSITIDCDNDYFKMRGTIWEGYTLHELYSETYTPWEWQPKLKEVANGFGLDLFSSPFDETAVDFLENMNVPAYKIASFEVVDIPLIQKIAQTGKPIIMSTGMASLSEIDEAVETIRNAGGTQVALLKCTSSYPALPEEMNLRSIPHLSETFNVPTGLSDHTLGIAVPIAAVALGACIIEKHLTLSRKVPGPDSAFSIEPPEFTEMVNAVRIAEKALGKVHYGVSEHEKQSRVFRRSLFVVKDMKAGEIFSGENIRSIRPGYGMHTRYFRDVIGKYAVVDIKRGSPLEWPMISNNTFNKKVEA